MNDRKRWDEKHESRAAAPGEPAPSLVALLPRLPRGRALDLASGSGANARFLAAAGYTVDAMDWSRSALSRLRGSAVRAVVCDVTRMPFGTARYDLVTCFRFLDRSTWPRMVGALKPGGALLFETFTTRYLERKPDFPPGFCLAPGELLSALERTLRVAHYREETTACLLGFR